MNFREIINSIKPFSLNQYLHIKSDSRLGACTAYYLFQKNVPLTMNYLGIAMFKMFPESFYCDEDFKEYPSLDRINREICMHMTITKKKTDAILSGSAKKGFHLTPYGMHVGKEVFESLNKVNPTEVKFNKKPIDSHKEGPHSEYSRIINSKLFKDFQSNRNINPKGIWSLFNVTPFTQVTQIKKNLEMANLVAEEKGDHSVKEFIKALVSYL